MQRQSRLFAQPPSSSESPLGWLVAMRAASRRLLSSLPEVPRALSKAADVRTRLAAHHEAALLGGGQKRIEAQHGKGKLTARERVSLLVDEGTFREYDMLKAHLWMALHRRTERLQCNIVQPTKHVAAAGVTLGGGVMVLRVRTEAADKIEEAACGGVVGDILQDVLLRADELIRLGEQRRAARLDEQLRSICE